MNMKELAKWLEEKEHPVTLSLSMNWAGLHIKMMDNKTGQIQNGLLGSDLLEDFQLLIDDMYKSIMSRLGREEKENA